MSVETALVDKLSGTAGVTAQIGSGDSIRLYPDLAPAGTARPYATYIVVSESPSRHFAGITNSQVYFSRVQIDVWASTGLSRRTTADAIRAALDGFSGAMGDESLDVRRVAVVDLANSFERPESDDEIPIYRCRLEVEIDYR